MTTTPLHDLEITNDAYLSCHPGVRAIYETGLFEGIPVRIVAGGESIEEGDTYIAERNSGVKLLTCKDNNREFGWIRPVEIGYSFDTGECLKVELEL